MAEAAVSYPIDDYVKTSAEKTCLLLFLTLPLLPILNEECHHHFLGPIIVLLLFFSTMYDDEEDVVVSFLL